MLTGGDDISDDLFFFNVRIRACFRFVLIGGI